jgi:hypothetical protein
MAGVPSRCSRVQRGQQRLEGPGRQRLAAFSFSWAWKASRPAAWNTRSASSAEQHGVAVEGDAHLVGWASLARAAGADRAAGTPASSAARTSARGPTGTGWR